MKYIPKNFKLNMKQKWFKNLTSTDLIVVGTLLIILSVFWIPFFINKEIYIGAGLASIFVIIPFLLLIKILDMRLYLFIWRYIRYLFTNKEIKKQKIIKNINGNIIYLNDVDENKKIIYRIIGNDTQFIDDIEFEEISNNLTHFIRELNDSYIIKIDGNIDFNNSINFLKYKKQILKKKNININKEIDLTLSYLNELKQNSFTSTQSKYFLVIDYDEKNKTKYEDKMYEMEKLLKLSGLNLSRPSSMEIDQIIAEHFFDNQSFIEKWKYLIFSNTKNESYSMRNQFINIFNYIKFVADDDEKSEIINYCNFLKKNLTESKKKYITFVAIDNFPSEVNRNFLDPLFNHKGASVTMLIDDVDIKSLQKKLNIYKREVEVKCSTTLTDDLKNIENYNELEAINQIIEDVYNGSKMKNISILFKVEANSKNELSRKTRMFFKELTRLNFSFNRLCFNQVNALKTFIPNNANFLKKERIESNLLDSTISYGYPFTQHELIHNDSLVFGVDENLTPVFLDWSYRDMSNPSSSTILMGKTGSGKTTSAKRMIKNQIIQDKYQIYIIDPENEYGDLIEFFGGEKINLNDRNNTINPFDLSINNENIDKETLLKLISDKQMFLETFFKMIFYEKISTKEITKLLQITYRFYLKKKTKEFTFSDLLKFIQKNDFNLELNTVEQLKLFCKSEKGTYSSMWDSKTTINMNNNYICFELRDLLAKSKGDVGKAQIFLTLQYINNKVLNNRDIKNNRYINIILDEAHLLLDETYIEIAKFSTEMFKRIRKYNGMMTIITQNVNDFYKPSIRNYTEQLINNSHYILCHSIRPQEIEALNNLFKEDGGLNEIEKKFLKSGICGQCLLFFGNKRSKIQVKI